MRPPRFQVIGDVFRLNAERFGEKPAFVQPDGKSCTFAALGERVVRLVNVLRDSGLKAGDRVAILARNRIEYVEAYGVSAGGFIALPLNWRLSPQELSGVLENAQPAALLVESSFIPVIEAMRAALPFVSHFISFDAPPSGWQSYEALLSGASSAPLEARVSPGDTACLLYTSGTTGAPKGAELIHRSLLLNCETATREMFDLTDRDVTLAPMPFFHVGGMWYHLFPSFAAGATTVIMPQFDPRGVLELMARHRVTNTHLVPTMIHTLLEQPNLAAFDLTSLRRIFYAASSMPTDTLKRATAAFACGFAQGYGSTEAGVVTCLTPDDHRRAAMDREGLLLSCGRPLKSVELRLAPPDQADGEGIGEVLVRSPMTMARYWRNPDATAGALQDGWLRTGDLGRMDEEGYLYILDRKSDMIVTGGENVYPREVEEVMLQDVDIAEVAVFDLPDARWVQKVVAAVVLRNADVAPDVILARVRNKITGYKCPKDLFITDTLPKNAAGKILRKTLREIYGAR